LAAVAGAPGAVGFDDAGGRRVGVGHDRTAYTKFPSNR
jgi:hypothetical protein